MEGDVMDGNGLVSVIIIFLNGEKFIGEAIESVFGQTYDYWEVLLVDDGSTDDSTGIARYYAEKYPNKVRYLEHENHQNRGMSASRNLGIQNSRGEYIAFLDADDIYLPRKLKHQVEILKSVPEAGMVYGPTQYWYSWTDNPDDKQKDFFTSLDVEPHTLFQPPTLLTGYLKGTVNIPCMCGLLARREVIENIQGFVESFRGMYEDQVFFAKMSLATPIFVDSKCWDKYRQHPDSSTQLAYKVGFDHQFNKPNPARQIYLTWLTDYIATSGIKDNQLQSALKTALLPYNHPILYGISVFYQSCQNLIKSSLKSIAKKTFPAPLQRGITKLVRGKRYVPPVGKANLGCLRRVTPISQQCSSERGLPIDRYYIGSFLTSRSDDIRGRVLEIADPTYTKKFGGEKVVTSDVLHFTKGNPQATIIGDLTNAPHIPDNSFDCFILTQTLQFIYDVPAAIKTIYRILKPGGVVLVTFCGIVQTAGEQWDNYQYWSFTALSAQKLFEEVFPSENLQVKTYGNVLAATALLQGLATEELRPEELDYCDRNYEVIITVRGVK